MINSSHKYSVLKQSLNQTLLNTRTNFPLIASLTFLHQQHILFQQEFEYKNEKQTNCNCYKVIRPLLDCSRSDIARFCKYFNIPVYPDKSNQSLQYSRNRIRNQIVPTFQLFFNSQAEEALFQLAEFVSYEQEFVYRLIYILT